MNSLIKEIHIRSDVFDSLNLCAFVLSSRKTVLKNQNILTNRQGIWIIRNAVEVEKSSEFGSVGKI